MANTDAPYRMTLSWLEYLALAAGIRAISAVITTAIQTFGEIKKTTKLVDMPPEYWAAKKAEEEASTEQYRIKIEAQERLEMDKRDRLSSPSMTTWTRDSLAEHMKSVG